MKTGIIAPVADLDLVEGRDFHLCLSHLCANPDYLNFYRAESDRGAFITLDNSAHEHGKGEDILKLFEQADAIGASEIVLPDELFSHAGTVRRTQKALEQIERNSLKLMVVPQAPIDHPMAYWQCRSDLLKLVDRYRELFPRGVTIGLSKDYEVWPNGMHDIAARSISLSSSDCTIEHHLLGWGRQLLGLDQISRSVWASKIRSTDSAKPIMFAIAGIDLSVGLDKATYRGRAADFFTRSMTDSQRRLARRNIKVFDALSEGRYAHVR